LIASIPAATADPASFATSCATRVTRAIGAGTRVEPCRLLFDEPLDALRVDVLAPRLLLDELPLFDDADRLLPLRDVLDPLRDVLDAPADAADRPRDFVLLPRFLVLALRFDARLLDFPRDFLALVAIDASPRSR
jgi:hypothetical protein